MERKYKITLLIVVLLALGLALLESFSPTTPQIPAGGQNLTTTPSPENAVPLPPPTATPPPSGGPIVPPPKVSPGRQILPAALIKKLPYTTPDFVIEYFPKTKQLSVTVYSPNSSQAEKAVYAFLSQNGVTDPMSLDILWSKNQRFLR